MSTLGQTLRPTSLVSAYVLLVGVVATLGFTTDSTAAILLAALLALPLSPPAMVAYYLLYGLLAQVPGANPSTSSGSLTCPPDGACQGSSTGDLAGWFSVTTDVVGIVALSVAAVLNVVILRILRSRPRT